ncbi:MAG: hypothetical protein KBS76_07025 [Ruminococcus sp.]|nr:hypothetical protein [Candidatus Apopatosoma intestinale]
MMKDHVAFHREQFGRWFEGFYRGVKKSRETGFRRYWVSPMTDFEDFTCIPHYAYYLVMGYYLDGTPYTGKEELLTLADEVLSAYEEHIHEDGSVDLIVTNFHDPSQSGFVTRLALVAAAFIARYTHHTEAEDRLFAHYLTVMKRHGEAMLTLGFHTPNHRWVISSALAMLYDLTGDKRYRDYIDGFLSEGIDCDENGEYTERSAGMYNITCDLSFILMAIFLHDPSYYEYVSRNLKLVYSFMEPDGKICTLNSIRQDRSMSIDADNYYPYYLYMGLIDRNPEFAYTADNMMTKFESQAVMGHIPVNMDVLQLYLLNPEVFDRMKEIEPVAPPRDASVFLQKSGIARIYKPESNMTVTLVRQRHPVFLQLLCGHHMIQMRFAGAFFGDPHSQFRAQEIIRTEKGFALIADEAAGYRSQFDTPPETSEWRQMDHSKRHIINVQHFRTRIDVEVLSDGVNVEATADGCEGIQTKWELVMDPGGRLDTDGLVTICRPGDYLVLKEGSALYTFGDNNSFAISGGSYRHLYTKDMRGSAPADDKNVTVCMTGETPWHHRVEIRVGHNVYLDKRRKETFESGK